MGAVKKYFKKQFQSSMFKLEYRTASDFYGSCFQSNDSYLPLLVIRGILFFGSIAIVISSIVLTARGGEGGYWPIFLTHWGIAANMICTGIGFAVSLHAYIKQPFGDDFELPWLVKVYWISSNIAIPLSFFITIFYWTLLSGFVSEDGGELEFAINKVLDIFIHAINSVVMFLLLVTARQPVYLLHFYHVVLFALVYLFFSVIYYAAGGTDMFGNPFVYPMLDWSNPGIAVLTGVFSAVLIIILHFLVSFIVVGRDALSRWILN
ncbi:protein rolling stone-like [Colias croceus]|uniref:protein rolling stone-like n=1 Tax=Colias crocea TaxID=72248 RepID=UPI001E27EBB3|nr:protein rolling stone-like [Colias croceus]